MTSRILWVTLLQLRRFTGIDFKKAIEAIILKFPCNMYRYTTLFITYRVVFFTFPAFKYFWMRGWIMQSINYDITKYAILYISLAFHYYLHLHECVINIRKSFKYTLIYMLNEIAINRSQPGGFFCEFTIEIIVRTLRFLRTSWSRCNISK